MSLCLPADNLHTSPRFVSYLQRADPFFLIAEASMKGGTV